MAEAALAAARPGRPGLLQGAAAARAAAWPSGLALRPAGGQRAGEQLRAPVPLGGAAPAAAPPHVSSNLVDIESPMVGTFYRGPAPDAPPYIDTGTDVALGDTLCIIEAMKLMNEFECEVRGTIVEICVENAQPVEYGQVLFRVDPA